MTKKVIKFVYGDVNENLNDEMCFLNRGILCPLNDSVMEINNKVTEII